MKPVLRNRLAWALGLGAVTIAFIGIAGVTSWPRSGVDQAPITASTIEPVDQSGTHSWPESPSQAGTLSPVSSLAPTNSLSTELDGEVIEGLHVTGSITIAHDNVTVRDIKLDLTGNYGLYVPERSDGSCPAGTVFENVEIDGRSAADTDTPVYGEGCGFVLSDAYVHDTGQAVKVMGDSMIQDSYIVTSESGSDAHRNALEVRGHNNRILHNYLVCSAPDGCSAALAIYNDVTTVADVLVEGNFMAANAAYCLYGGSSHDNGFPPASNVDIIDNYFSVMIHPTCGRSGFLTAHDVGLNGNERAGNLVFETGKPVP
jgi:hypothetical protein